MHRLRLLWKRFAVGLVLITVLMTLVATAWLVTFLNAAPHDPINRESVSKIRIGMVESEVETVLGGPPGNYGRGENPRLEINDLSMFPEGVTKEWLGEEYGIAVRFLAGKVIAKTSGPVNRLPSVSWIDHVREYFGWQRTFSAN
jgi:hypothetical protein